MKACKFIKKRGSSTGVFQSILRNFKNTFFIEHLWWLLLYIHSFIHPCKDKKVKGICKIIWRALIYFPYYRAQLARTCSKSKMETLKQSVKSIQSYGDVVIDVVLFSLLLTLNKLRTLFWCLLHVETSKMICFANQLTCFHVGNLVILLFTLRMELPARS